VALVLQGLVQTFDLLLPLELRVRAVQAQLSMMCHSFPALRVFVAEQFYVMLLTMGPAFLGYFRTNIPPQALDEALVVLTQTPW
jgi:hypothetical protein